MNDVDPGSLERHLHADLHPGGDERLQQRAVAVPTCRRDDGTECDGTRPARRGENLERLLAAQDASPPSRIVTQQAGRNETGRRLCESSQPLPDEIAGPHDSGKDTPEGPVPYRRPRESVEEQEERVLPRDLDHPSSKPGVPEDLLEIIRRKLVAQVDLSGPQPGGERRAAQPGPELQGVDVRFA